MKIWRHKKTGGLYVILDDSILIESTMEKGILYMSLHDGQKWVRPFEEFCDGRFELLNSMEYEEGVVRLKKDGSF